MALSLVLEASQRGILPDLESFQSAMGALEKAKQGTRAHELLGKMKEIGLAPEKDMLDTVVRLLQETGETDKAAEIIMEIEMRFKNGEGGDAL